MPCAKSLGALSDWLETEDDSDSHTDTDNELESECYTKLTENVHDRLTESTAGEANVSLTVRAGSRQTPWLKLTCMGGLPDLEFPTTICIKYLGQTDATPWVQHTAHYSVPPTSKWNGRTLSPAIAIEGSASKPISNLLLV